MADDREKQKLEEALRKAEEWHNEVVRQRDEARDLLEWAWGIIANAGSGDWTKESPEWQKAAGNWRDRVHDLGAVRS